MKENCNIYRQMLLNNDLCMTLSYCNDLTGEDKIISMLSSVELDRLFRIKNEHARRSFLVGRYAAKYAMDGLFPGRSVRDIIVTNGIFHEPVVDLYDISISHTDKFGAAIVSRTKSYLGIDVEMNDAKHNQSIEMVLSEQEKEMLCKKNLHIMGWTVKEAISKVLRTGMTTDYKVYEINKIYEENDMYISFYSHFTQYKAISILVKGIWITIAVPKLYDIQLDVAKIIEFFERSYE